MDIVAEVLERFLRYVRIDTQSDEHSKSYPSTANQLDLLNLLVGELQAIGLVEVRMDEHGYVTATLPSTIPPDDPKASAVPIVGFLAHVDTTPEITGANVQPQVVRNYQGGPIVLPGDTTQVISPDEEPDLLRCLGHDVVTSDGTTLLGADDKAGVAEIVTAMAYLVGHPELRHGKVRVAFTPDEEVGHGTEHFDVAAFGAQCAYTMDGGEIGEIEDETFNAATATVTCCGRNVHPGYARGKLVNALKLAAALIERLPKDRLSPETTAGREGYLHPIQIAGSTEQVQLKFIVRDFEASGLAEKEECLRRLAREVELLDPRSRIEVVVKESYRNMKEVLQHHPQVAANAEEAMRRAGVQPKRTIVRGGTDGARLTFMGLPTPNLFAGGHNFHSKREWVSAQDMASAVETIVQLVQVWAE